MSNTNSFESKLQAVEQLVKKLGSGKLNAEELSSLVENTRDLYERSVVLQYKAFEEKVFGDRPAPVTTDVEEVVENLIIEEPEIAEEIIIEEPVDTMPESFEKEEALAFDFMLFDDLESNEADVPEEKEEQIIEAVIPEEKEEHVSISHTHSDENGIHEEHVVVGKTTTSFSSDAVESLANFYNRELQNNSSGFPLPKLDTLVGSFGLNERLQFINELFGGSSEDFAIAVSELDQVGGFNEALHLAASMGLSRGWDKESETVLDFLTKVKRRHA